MTTILEKMEQAARESAIARGLAGLSIDGELAVRAAYAWLEAEGFVIVPKEPTDEMIAAAWRCAPSYTSPLKTGISMADCWTAMCATAREL